MHNATSFKVSKARAEYRKRQRKAFRTLLDFFLSSLCRLLTAEPTVPLMAEKTAMIMLIELFFLFK